MEVMEKITQAIQSNPVILFMKGTPEFPQCGFSSRASQAISACGAEFAYVNVLAEPDVRENLHRYADWPTFPQLYIKGELVGGCDIIMELYENGELQKMIDEAS
ncbi:MAG: Grx4 family monothiol glutaredoxin [Pseudomonadota bacterium]|jgi:monothiol glutaredoxin|uniref:Glutaredoxin n=2 Tax=Methylophaga TaxID=40222 RepID=F5T018_9GAMM|nr:MULTISPECIES: Grx4 family monothiol glutaredoxin [Methylophaga]MEC9411287.1 Grx4 family monothiol glutaredoxin [Pseudomonadota bacterium]EGL54854.1 glutaredoxin-related protein [Methylophaga aminisulfidivorans MP]WVI84447.1 Grx4 family monothiol glutaredoxin [Methylophaga thalassica]GLP99518.1 glutaredoxin [Methylophaga thalassica]HIC47663.1 Grx4 family monothiol glutaredoxin [Methylophaga sp.]